MKSKTIHHFLIYLTLIGVISPLTVYSDSIISMDINNTANKHIVANTDQTSSTINNSPNEKKILTEHSRGLSAFFILGIIINIIMAITFGRWFYKEWTSPKNNKG